MKVKSSLLTRTNDSIILGKGNAIPRATKQANKVAINKLQSVAWEMNEELLMFPEFRDEYVPDTAMTKLEARQAKDAFNIRDAETDDVIEYLLLNGNRFFFGWRYDKRGRMYSQGYHVNPQGNQYRKAMLQFADKEVLNAEGKRYLLIDIANTYGYDKLTWFQRTMKAKAMVADIFADGRSRDKKIRAYASNADDHLLFMKAILAWKAGVIEGKAIGHNMGLDGTASGIQFMSALSACSVSARQSNVHACEERTTAHNVQDRIAELELELASL